MHSGLVEEQMEDAAKNIQKEATPFIAHRGTNTITSGTLKQSWEQPVKPDDEWAPPTRAKIAEDLVNGDRAKDYGDANMNLELIAAYWSLHLGTEVTKTDVCILMDLLKTARLKHTPGHEDSWVDKVGYILLQAKIDRRD